MKELTPSFHIVNSLHTALERSMTFCSSPSSNGETHAHSCLWTHLGACRLEPMELSERRGQMPHVHKYVELHCHVRCSLTPRRSVPRRTVVAVWSPSKQTPTKKRHHDQEIFRWWKLEDERRQKKPRGAHPHHERSQGGPQCRYVDFAKTATRYKRLSF